MGVEKQAGGPVVGFVIAGVQKSGTTALFDYLRLHPQLNMAPDKEVHFFDDDARDWSAPDYGDYHAAFAADGPALWGEATPIYIYWPQALERIAAYNPAMRIIVLFRDPVERAWSQWKMESTRTETESFSWCIREGRAAVTGEAGVHRVRSYVERGFYGDQVKRLFSLFPLEQVLLLSSRDLRNNPARILRNVCDFLGIAPFDKVEPVESHVGPEDDHDRSMSAEDKKHLREIFADDQKSFRAMTEIDLDER